MYPVRRPECRLGGRERRGMMGGGGKEGCEKPVQFHVEIFRVPLPIEEDVIGTVGLVSSWVVVTGVVAVYVSKDM